MKTDYPLKVCISPKTQLAISTTSDGDVGISVESLGNGSRWDSTSRLLLSRGAAAALAIALLEKTGNEHMLARKFRRPEN